MAYATTRPRAKKRSSRSSGITDSYGNISRGLAHAFISAHLGLRIIAALAQLTVLTPRVTLGEDLVPTAPATWAIGGAGLVVATLSPYLSATSRYQLLCYLQRGIEFLERSGGYQYAFLGTMATLAAETEPAPARLIEPVLDAPMATAGEYANSWYLFAGATGLAAVIAALVPHLLEKKVSNTDYNKVKEHSRVLQNISTGVNSVADAVITVSVSNIRATLTDPNKCKAAIEIRSRYHAQIYAAAMLGMNTRKFWPVLGSAIDRTVHAASVARSVVAAVTAIEGLSTNHAAIGAAAIVAGSTTFDTAYAIHQNRRLATRGILATDTLQWAWFNAKKKPGFSACKERGAVCCSYVVLKMHRSLLKFFLEAAKTITAVAAIAEAVSPGILLGKGRNTGLLLGLAIGIAALMACLVMYASKKASSEIIETLRYMPTNSSISPSGRQTPRHPVRLGTSSNTSALRARRLPPDRGVVATTFRTGAVAPQPLLLRNTGPGMTTPDV